MPITRHLTVGETHDFALAQAYGKDAHVIAWNSSVRVDNGAPLKGRYVRDEGEYFAIRFPHYGTAVYRRTGDRLYMRDRGVLVIVI